MRAILSSLAERLALALLKRVWGVTLRGPKAPSVPLPYRDVAHQQDQIRRATTIIPPPKSSKTIAAEELIEAGIITDAMVRQYGFKDLRDFLDSCYEYDRFGG